MVSCWCCLCRAMCLQHRGNASPGWRWPESWWRGTNIRRGWWSCRRLSDGRRWSGKTGSSEARRGWYEAEQIEDSLLQLISTNQSYFFYINTIIASYLLNYTLLARSQFTLKMDENEGETFISISKAGSRISTAVLQKIPFSPQVNLLFVICIVDKPVNCWSKLRLIKLNLVDWENHDSGSYSVILWYNRDI